jgi:hypothetical protein
MVGLYNRIFPLGSGIGQRSQMAVQRKQIGVPRKQILFLGIPSADEKKKLTEFQSSR